MKNALGVVLGLLLGVAINLELGLLSVALDDGQVGEDSTSVMKLGALLLLLLLAASCTFVLLRRAASTRVVLMRACTFGLVVAIAMFPIVDFAKARVADAAGRTNDFLAVFEMQREKEAFDMTASALILMSSIGMVLCAGTLGVMFLSRRDDARMTESAKLNAKSNGRPNKPLNLTKSPLR